MLEAIGIIVLIWFVIMLYYAIKGDGWDQRVK